MNNGKATLVFLCIFVSGAVSGVFFGMRLACTSAKAPKHQATQNNSSGSSRPVEDWSKRQQKEFSERLEITAEQQAKCDPVFKAAQAELRRQRKLFSQNVAEIVEHRDAKLLELLTPEQKLKYEALLKERKEKAQKLEAERAMAHGDATAKPGESPASPKKKQRAAPPVAPAPTKAP